MSGKRLAKLTCPRLHGAMARERLFRLLDSKREHAMVWVVGPPGSGKTTLVASYAKAVSAPLAWYLLDRADSDPATFFYYLAQAVAGVTKARGNPLPALSPEYHADLEGFCRRFMRIAFARMPAGCLIVLDNYHEIVESSHLHRMLNAAIQEIPESANVLVISRSAPPAVYSRMRLTGSLEILDWNDLRLDPSETRAIVFRRFGPDTQAAVLIHERSGGWIAGVTLLLEQGSHAGRGEPQQRPEALESAFDYFATEIFEAASAAVRHTLLRTSFFPRFTAEMASALTGDADAAGHIEQMYRKHLFVDRRVAEKTTFQYHDLFRAFLQNRASTDLSPTEAAELAGRAANLLAADGQAAEAFALFVQACDWDGAEALFLECADKLVRQGRWRTLDQWGEAFPPERLAASPWLGYWLGRSRALVAPGEAYAILELVYTRFVVAEDRKGQLLCAAEIIETLHFFASHWEAMAKWLERLVAALASMPEAIDPDDELRVHATLFWAAENIDPASPMVSPSVMRVQQLLPRCADVNVTVSVANMLHYHTVRSLDLPASSTAAREARRVLDSEALSPDRRALYYLAEGMTHVDAARYRDALECYDRADAVIREHELPGRAYISATWRAMCLSLSGDVRAARATLEEIDRMPALDLPVINQVLCSARAWDAFAHDDIERALAHLQAGIDISLQWGPAAVLGFQYPMQAYFHIASGHLSQAEDSLASIRSRAWLESFGHFKGAVMLLEAWHALRSRAYDACHRTLRIALAHARDPRERLRMRWYPIALSELLAVALEHEIEVQAAHTLIRELGLDPPAGADQSWPWPVIIHTLGRFEVRVDGTPLAFGRKVPKRTLALLQALVSMGGRDVPEQQLADALWPDLDGDAGLESLSAALHRLRRMLGSNNTIRQGGGRLSLDTKRCFVDALAFEASISGALDPGSILRLYEGNFLEGLQDAPWAVSMRERLRSTFVRTVEAAAAALEEQGGHQQALDLYVRGIETDDLVEPFYRGLMRCYVRLGRTAEAASTFRRLRQTLSITLGTRPSPESELLFKALQLQ